MTVASSVTAPTIPGKRPVRSARPACQAPGCWREPPTTKRGFPAKYCSRACEMRAWRARQQARLRVKVNGQVSTPVHLPPRAAINDGVALAAGRELARVYLDVARILLDGVDAPEIARRWMNVVTPESAIAIAEAMWDEAMATRRARS